MPYPARTSAAFAQTNWERVKPKAASGSISASDLDTIEREGYLLRHSYSDRKTLRAALRMGGSMLGSMLGDAAGRPGLVTKVVPHEELLDAAMGLATTIAKQPPSALTYTRRALQHSQWATLEQHLEYEWANQRKCLASDEFKEGVAAFREKREPDYRQF